jgi:hypothetical protein
MPTLFDPMDSSVSSRDEFGAEEDEEGDDTTFQELRDQSLALRQATLHLLTPALELTSPDLDPSSSNETSTGERMVSAAAPRAETIPTRNVATTYVATSVAPTIGISTTNPKHQLKSPPPSKTTREGVNDRTRTNTAEGNAPSRCPPVALALPPRPAPSAKDTSPAATSSAASTGRHCDLHNTDDLGPDSDRKPAAITTPDQRPSKHMQDDDSFASLMNDTDSRRNTESRDLCFSDPKMLQVTMLPPLPHSVARPHPKPNATPRTRLSPAQRLEATMLTLTPHSTKKNTVHTGPKTYATVGDTRATIVLHEQRFLQLSDDISNGEAKIVADLEAKHLENQANNQRVVAGIRAKRTADKQDTVTFVHQMHVDKVARAFDGEPDPVLMASAVQYEDFVMSSVINATYDTLWTARGFTEEGVDWPHFGKYALDEEDGLHEINFPDSDKFHLAEKREQSHLQWRITYLTRKIAEKESPSFVSPSAATTPSGPRVPGSNKRRRTTSGQRLLHDIQGWEHRIHSAP